MKNIPENAEDLDAEVVGGVLDIIDSSKFIAAGSAKNAADTIVNKLMGGDNDLTKDGSWVNTLKKLFNQEDNVVLELMKSRIIGKNKKIALPEGDDIRVLKAACRLYRENVALPILLGNKETIESLAKSNGLDINGMEIVDPILDSRYEDYA